jgi:hypothetical protein
MRLLVNAPLHPSPVPVGRPPSGVHLDGIELTRRSVQSQAKNRVFPLDEYPSPSVVNLTFLYYRLRDTYRMMCAMKKVGWSSILVAAMLLAVAVLAEAQQPKKVPRIGYLSNTDPAGESTRSEAIRVAVQERGYREGQNIATESRCAEGRGKKVMPLTFATPGNHCQAPKGR